MAKTYWHSLLNQSLSLPVRFQNDHWLIFLKDLSPSITAIPNTINWEDLFPFMIWNLWLNKNSNNINNTTHSPSHALAVKHALEYKPCTEKETNLLRKFPSLFHGMHPQRMVQT